MIQMTIEYTTMAIRIGTKINAPNPQVTMLPITQITDAMNSMRMKFSASFPCQSMNLDWSFLISQMTSGPTNVSPPSTTRLMRADRWTNIAQFFSSVVGTAKDDSAGAATATGSGVGSGPLLIPISLSSVSFGCVSSLSLSIDLAQGHIILTSYSGTI